MADNSKMIARAYATAKDAIGTKRYSGESLEILELYVRVYESGVQATADYKRFATGKTLRDIANAWQAKDRIKTCIDICECLAPAVFAVVGGKRPSMDRDSWFGRGVKPDTSTWEPAGIVVKPRTTGGRGDYWGR